MKTKRQAIRFGTLVSAIPMCAWFGYMMFFGFEIREISSYLFVFAIVVSGCYVWAYAFWLIFRTRDKETDSPD